jgi:hypothetical protein
MIIGLIKSQFPQEALQMQDAYDCELEEISLKDLNFALNAFIQKAKENK